MQPDGSAPWRTQLESWLRFVGIRMRRERAGQHGVGDLLELDFVRHEGMEALADFMFWPKSGDADYEAAMRDLVRRISPIYGELNQQFGVPSFAEAIYQHHVGAISTDRLLDLPEVWPWSPSLPRHLERYGGWTTTWTLATGSPDDLDAALQRGWLGAELHCQLSVIAEDAWRRQRENGEQYWDQWGTGELWLVWLLIRYLLANSR